MGTFPSTDDILQSWYLKPHNAYAGIPQIAENESAVALQSAVCFPI